MAGIISFQALAFDLVDGRPVQGKQVNCESPALAIQTAQGLWKVFGYAGAVAVSRNSSFDGEATNPLLVLRRFGQVPAVYLTDPAGA